MRWFHRLRTWQRVMLAFGIVLIVLASANLIFDLGWPFVNLALPLWAIVVSILTFRELMRQAIAAEKSPESMSPTDEE